MSKESSVQHVVSTRDWDDFIAVCYFGRDGDWLDRCMRRAYLDMNRTLHGVAGRLGGNHSAWTDALLHVLKDRLMILPSRHTWTQVSFDAWHCESVDELQRVSSEHGFPLFVGQAQKWINMSIKYAIALGEQRLPGFSGVYEVAHIPLDNIVLDALVTGLAGKKMGRLPHTWSRIPSYAEYLSCQLWVRTNLPGIPLEIEYQLWGTGALTNRPSEAIDRD